MIFLISLIILILRKQLLIRYDKKNVFDFELGKTVDERILIKKFSDAMDKKQKRSVEVDVKNTDRALGTLLGAEITRRFGESLADDTYTVKCTGAGGQSFGAFIPKGLTLNLTGDSNDYFGKGLSGGKLIVKVPEKAAYKPEENIIIGNVAFMVLPAVMLLSTVLQENVLQFVTQVPMQLLRVSVSMDVNI